MSRVSDKQETAEKRQAKVRWEKHFSTMKHDVNARWRQRDILSRGDPLGHDV